MKYVKILSLLVVAAAALMASVGTASATLTTGTGGLATEFHAKSSGAVSTTGSLTVTCQKSTLGGLITTNDANEASGPITTWTFEECGPHTITVTSKGVLKVTDSAANATTGTVYSAGLSVTKLLHSFLFGTVHCTYVTSHANPTDIGTLTESDHNPGPGAHTTATLHISASLSRDPETSDVPCGDHHTFEGTYEVTSPDHLYID